jgi:hypothetical protein
VSCSTPALGGPPTILTKSPGSPRPTPRWRWPWRKPTPEVTERVCATIAVVLGGAGIAALADSEEIRRVGSLTVCIALVERRRASISTVVTTTNSLTNHPLDDA